METEQHITLNVAGTHLRLTSNFVKTGVQGGVKMSVRTYPIAYSRFPTISSAKDLSFTLEDVTVAIPPWKMAGLREIARRIRLSNR